MSGPFERLDFGPGWRTTNDNLIELVDLFRDDGLDWSPRKGEWSARTIFAHIVGARYHGPIPSEDDLAHLSHTMTNCGSAEGIQEELRRSWEMLARFLSSAARLDATYEQPVSAESEPAPPEVGSVDRSQAGFDLGYVDDVDAYTGHYIVYHRFAHDLHHRSTLVGYLSQLGVSLDGHRIRPL